MTILKVKNLQKHYLVPGEGNQVILDIENFELLKNEQVALKGSSGGKSTFLNAIAGIIRLMKVPLKLMVPRLVYFQNPNEISSEVKKSAYFLVFSSFARLYTLENVILGMSFSGNMNYELERFVDTSGSRKSYSSHTRSVKRWSMSESCYR